MNEALVELVSAWWNWTAAMSVQLALLGAIVVILDRLLARWAWPQLLAAVWFVVLVKLVVPPWIASPISIARLAPQPPRLASSVASPENAAGPATIAVLAFVVWLVGVIALTTLAAWRYRRLRRLWLGAPAIAPPDWFEPLLKAASARIGLRRVPRILIQAQADGPAVVGVFRPIIVLPHGLVTGGRPAVDRGAGSGDPRTTWPALEHVLLHELAHIKRRDPLWNLLGLVAQLAYWFHPVVWLARRRLATLREVGCDQTVARLVDGASAAYRRTLLELSRPMIDGRPRLGMGFIHRQSQILARLDWLERPCSSKPRLKLAATAATFFALCGTCLPLAHSTTGPTGPLPDGRGSRATRHPPLTTQIVRGFPEVPVVRASPDVTVVRGSPDLKVVRGSPDPAQRSTAGLPPSTSHAPPATQHELNDLEGCLQLRYVVFGLMGQQESSQGEES